MFDFVNFVLDVDELLVGFVFAVMGLVAVVVVGFLGLRFYCDGIHFILVWFYSLRGFGCLRFWVSIFRFFWRFEDYIFGGEGV